MKKIKPTSKADINKKVKELEEITQSMNELITNYNVIAGKLKLTFSNDFAECHKYAGFMLKANEQFNEVLKRVVTLYTSLSDLSYAIIPNIANHHWEDLADPDYDETKGPKQELLNN